MSTELVTLRILVVCAYASEFELLREGAALASLPLDPLWAESAHKATNLLSSFRPIDLVLVDGRLSEPDQAMITSAARKAEKPAFVVLLADEQTKQTATAASADAMTTKPRDAHAAQIMLNGCARSRLSHRVLVVDDSATMRSIVKKILGASHFLLQAADAAEGQTALNLIARNAADIVFLDYNMPGLNGVETLKALKQSHPRVRVVIMTSASDDSVAQLALNAGADAFLKKPFYPADVDKVIYGLFGLTQLMPAQS
jgi:CheY-like chemotaxis protein